MELGEKLQQLRKSRDLTQEELAEALYVSRTAVSKWESGRGYPSIDSLKEISSYFGVSVDALLSGEKLIGLAARENRANLRRLCETLFALTDLMTLLLIVLPLYPKVVEGYVYAVSLPTYAKTARYGTVYWALFAALAAAGAVKLALHQCKLLRFRRAVTVCSVVLGIAAVLALALAGETYAVALAFLLLLIKGGLLFKSAKIG